MYTQGPRNIDTYSFFNNFLNILARFSSSQPLSLPPDSLLALDVLLFFSLIFSFSGSLIPHRGRKPTWFKSWLHFSCLPTLLTILWFHPQASSTSFADANFCSRCSGTDPTHSALRGHSWDCLRCKLSTQYKIEEQRKDTIFYQVRSLKWASQSHKEDFQRKLPNRT